MARKFTNVIVGIVFIALLIGTGMTQTHLKNKPQIFMLALGLITLISFCSKQKVISSILFYIILTIMLYVNIFC